MQENHFIKKKANIKYIEQFSTWYNSYEEAIMSNKETKTIIN